MKIASRNRQIFAATDFVTRCLARFIPGSTTRLNGEDNGKKTFKQRPVRW
jgi:hypothetical protein